MAMVVTTAVVFVVVDDAIAIAVAGAVVVFVGVVY